MELGIYNRIRDGNWIWTVVFLNAPVKVSWIQWCLLENAFDQALINSFWIVRHSQCLHMFGVQRETTEKKLAGLVKKNSENLLSWNRGWCCVLKRCAEQRRRRLRELRAHAHGFSVVKPSSLLEWSSILVVPAPSLKKDGIPSYTKSMTCFERGLKLSPLLWFQL